MPIMSYIAQPLEGKRELLLSELAHLENTEVYPAENDNTLIILTDTKTDQEDEVLQEKLKNIPSLGILNLVYALSDETIIEVENESC
ncbi:MAG: hypothetical protein H6622_00255 [Halobacteriovoraceae bacterium]|nr:hypothetical protein [Halobacteriovoraceae bacterium]